MPPPLLALTDSPLLDPQHPEVARYLQFTAFFNGYKVSQAREQAALLTEELDRTPPGRRTLQPFYILAFQMDWAKNPDAAIRALENGEIDVREETRTLAPLGHMLKDRGVTLDTIYCDNENDLSWTLPRELLSRIYKNPRCRERFPAPLCDFDYDRLQFMSPEYHRWLIHWGNYAQKIKINALRKVLIESELLPLSLSPTTATNFNALRTSFRVYDYNGWEIEYQDLIDHRTSCPVCMIGPQGQRYQNRQHSPWWNGFIDALNHARTCAARGPILPVIRECARPRDTTHPPALRTPPAEPHPTAPWLVDQLIGHLIRTGARTFMFFHAHVTRADEYAVAAAMKRHEHAAPAALPTLPEIPLDVDEIVTGDFRTTYSDFLKQRPDEWQQKV